METLIDKNISPTDLIKPNHDQSRQVPNSFLYQLTESLGLIKRWQHRSTREVCKHMRKCSLR